MESERLIESACEQTGLDDFGSDSFREGLVRYVDALNTEAQLSAIGAVALEAQVTGNLVNRLRVVDWVKQHPEVRDEPVAAPLFVLGLPRSGTTYISRLLGCDPARRPLMGWEARDCVPPPEAATFTTDPRIAEARAAADMLDALNPAVKAMHYEAPDEPTECVTLLAQDFKSLQLSVVANVPTYDEWLIGCDETSAYQHHHLVLQLLQSRAPGRWSLKSPHHSIALPELFAQYPDARVVVMHRDPVRVAASLCSLAAALIGTFSDADHRATIATHWPPIAGVIVDRVMEYRDAHGDASFLDVQYADLVADPLATMKRIYDWAGDDLTAEAETRMREYVAANPQTRFGTHSYSLEGTGLDRRELEERFATYRDRYAVPSEA
ncbi:MAG TPA: sulfotransferase [Acidimicrobiia bacterium]|nr:sulfotransferase [Acidimicrobiia bacterium]